jgi:lipoate-protein ligase A
LKSFLADGDLDKYATKFPKIPEKQKDVFPYEFLSTENYVSELNKQELFQHQDFKSSLKQKIFQNLNTILTKNYQKI